MSLGEVEGNEEKEGMKVGAIHKAGRTFHAGSVSVVSRKIEMEGTKKISELDGPKSVCMGEHILRLEDETDVGESFIEKARNELRETEEIREQAIKELRALIENTPGMRFPVDDEVALLAFLRVCHFYVQSAYDKLLYNYKFKEKNPKYCANLTSKDDIVFRHNIFTILPYRDQHGRRNLLIEAGKKWNPKEVSLTELVRGIMIIVHAALLEPRTQIAGANIIIDLEGLSLSHVWQFSPSFAKLLVDWVQESVPARIKAIHIVNQPYLFNMLFSIFKPFLNQKLRSRIFFHGENRASLLEHISSKFIPTQYGGDMILETNHGMALHEIISHYEDKLEELNTYGFDTDPKTNGKK